MEISPGIAFEELFLTLFCHHTKKANSFFVFFDFMNELGLFSTCVIHPIKKQAEMGKCNGSREYIHVKKWQNYEKIWHSLKGGKT